MEQLLLLRGKNCYSKLPIILVDKVTFDYSEYEVDYNKVFEYE